jgi:tRNA(Met) C34 N-acetyltransferase TmcA
MVRKKLDARVRTLIERSVVTGQRSMLVLVGDHGKDQVPNLHQLLARTSVKARPKVLWCYKKELGFSTHRMKVRFRTPLSVKECPVGLCEATTITIARSKHIDIIAVTSIILRV